MTHHSPSTVIDARYPTRNPEPTHEDDMTTPLASLSHRIGAGLALAVLALLGLTLTAPTASADDGSSGGGWVRMAHLSPDTPGVDVSLTSLAGAKAQPTLRNIRYGDVSAYRRLPAGTYVAAMTPAGAGSTTPKIEQTITVKDGYAYTVAAVGREADLSVKVIPDDLTPPAQGTAKIRLLQASTVAPRVDVNAVQGPTLARDAAFGTATGYAEIDPGVWTVKVTPTSGSADAVRSKVTTQPGSVNTVVVLDGPRGQVEVTQLKDASGASAMPKKKTGVETGEGGTATDIVGTAPGHPARDLSLLAAALGVAGLAVGRRSLRARR